VETAASAMRRRSGPGFRRCVLWVAGSIGLLVSGWVAPTMLGTAFVTAQAVVVGVLAELQFVGLRRGATAPA
jgi:hypothetical protein